MTSVDSLISSCLKVIDGRAANWRGAVDVQNLLLRNFLLIFPNNSADIEALGLYLHVDPKRFHVLDLPSIYSLKDYIESDDLVLVRLAFTAAAKVFLIEQIDLPENAPPHVPPFMVYCLIRGVVSVHADLDEARHRWLTYNRDSLERGQFPEAKLYRWENDGWIPYRSV